MPDDKPQDIALPVLSADSPPVSASAPEASEPAPSDVPIRKRIKGKVIAALRTVYDPEIPVDIYELGLIYGIEITDANDVKVVMTLTSPACPVAGSLPVEVERKVAAIPEVHDAEVELTWDPPWSKDRMSEAAMLQLGLY